MILIFGPIPYQNQGSVYIYWHPTCNRFRNQNSSIKMFHNSSVKSLMKESNSKPSSPIPTLKLKDTSAELSTLRRNSAYSDQAENYSPVFKTLPDDNQPRFGKRQKQGSNKDGTPKEVRLGHMTRCTSQHLESLMTLNSENPKKVNSEIHALKCENRKLKLQISDLILKQSKMHQLQRDHQKLGLQFQKLATAKNSFQDMLIKEIDFSKQLQKRIDIQSAQNDTLKQEIKLLQSVVSDMRKHQSVLGGRVGQVDKCDRQVGSACERIDTLEGYCFQLQKRIYEDAQEWQSQKLAWGRESEAQDSLVRKLQAQVSRLEDLQNL